MGKFNRSGGFRGNRGGQGRDHGRRDKKMFSAVCSECGQDCEVPFRPTGEKPVYCSECFQGKGEGSYSRERQEKKMFSATCEACGRDCQVPFRPTGEKPVYCSECFNDQKKQGQAGSRQQDFSQQFEELNTKLDKLIQALIPKPKVIVKALEKEEKKDTKIKSTKVKKAKTTKKISKSTKVKKAKTKKATKKKKK